MVISGVNTVTYNGDGITTAWPYTYEVTDASEIRIQLNNADGTAVIVESDYYVDLINSTVYYPGYAPGSEPPEAEQPPKVQEGQTITVYREIPITQESDLGEKWPFEVIEKGLDKLTMIAQQIYSYTDRKLDAALASMFQLAGIVTDSGKLQHITDQYNAIDANAATATAKATAAANSATAAANSANAASGSATNSANSAASAETTATALINFLETKETLTAPAVDPTLTISGAAADAKVTGEKLSNVFDDLELDVPVINAQMVGVDNSNYYINASGVVISLSSSTYHVVQYAVKKDVTYYLKGTDVRLNTSVPLACFSTNPVASNLQTDETIITGSNVPSTYDSQYVPSSDGYILVAYIEGYAELNLYDSVLTSKRLKDIEHNLVEVNDSLGEYVIVPDEEQTGTDTPHKYINASGGLGNATSPELHVVEYPVTQGTQYVLHGDSVKLSAAFPLAIFGLEPLATNTGDNTILVNGSKVATNYNVTYTAPSDGYIFIAYYEQGGQLKLYSAKYDSQRLIDIENGQGTVKTPIKIQLFGDSITDDVRVNEGQEINITTWANFIDDYMANYDVTLINSAVGGSGIGHGKSSTARYSTKTYNYVHDLVTDGTLDTSADLICMLIGTNNWRGEGGQSYGTLGQLGDSTVSSFYGALDLICKYISEHTDALFVIATPPQRYNTADSESPTDSLGQVLNSYNHTLKDFAKAMVEVGALYGFPVINLNDELGWNKYNVANYTTDGLHPRGDECYRIAQYICEVWKTHLGE